jgi:hypothetical protein
LAGGSVVPDAYGLITVTGMEISPEGNRLTIQRPEAVVSRAFLPLMNAYR